MSTNPRRVGAAVSAVLLALAMALPALAHAELVSSTPGDGAVLAQPPTEVEVRFSEGISADRSSFRLLGPRGEEGTGTLNRDGGRILRLAGLALGPGAYEIRWTIGSADGHVERGRIRFTVSEPAPVQASPSTAAPGSASPAPEATPSPEPSLPATASADPSPRPAPGTGEPVAGSGADVIIPIVAALLLVALAGAYVLRRGRAV